MSLCPLQRKCGVSTTGLPGKSLDDIWGTKSWKNTNFQIQHSSLQVLPLLHWYVQKIRVRISPLFSVRFWNKNHCMLDLGYVAGINACHSYKPGSAATGLCCNGSHCRPPLWVHALHQCGYSLLLCCPGPFGPVSEHIGGKRSVKIAIKSSDKTSCHLLRATLC